VKGNKFRVVTAAERREREGEDRVEEKEVNKGRRIYYLYQLETSSRSLLPCYFQ